MNFFAVKNSRAVRRIGARCSHASSGFTLVELLMVMAISIIICAFAVPNLQNSMTSYRLGAAASAISGAIQATRYQAITGGCTYQLTLTSGSQNYQVTAQTISGSPPACSTTYSNIGSAVQWSTSSSISLNSSITYTFSPNGTVSTNVSGNVIQLSVNNLWKTITVSGTGYVTLGSQ
jgi:prepilin-type N-terminal cleavage/methylation domain-containing protein